MGILASIKPYIPISCLALLIIIFGVATFMMKGSTTNTRSQVVPTITTPLTETSLHSFSGQSVTPPLVHATPTGKITPTSLQTPSPTPHLQPTPTIAVASQSGGTTFSGTIQFTGQAPLSSRIVVFQRLTGTTNYQLAIDNLVPYNSSNWSWDSGTTAKSYDLIAILKQKQTNGNDLDLATSNVITTTATTSGTFSLAYNINLLAPSATISVSCNTFNTSSQTWQTSVSFQTVTGAAAYWFEVGTTDGGSELTTFTQNATNTTNQVISLPFQNGTTYYARYAYAAVPNVTIGSSELSPLSTSVQLRCSQ